MTVQDLARRIEHAVLGPQATEHDVSEAARVALHWEVRSLMVKPCHVPVASRLLSGSGVKVVAVVGFPHGGQTTEVGQDLRSVLSTPWLTIARLH